MYSQFMMHGQKNVKLIIKCRQNKPHCQMPVSKVSYWAQTKIRGISSLQNAVEKRPVYSELRPLN